MNFGEVLSRAWNIIWKHKVLWIFGLLASLGGGSGGGTGAQNSFQSQGGQLPAPFSGVERFFENMSPLGWTLLVLAVLVLVVVLILLGTLGRAGLARGAWLADSGEERLSFSRLYEESRRYFGRVLVLGILTFVISIALVALIAIPTALAAALTMGIAMICLLPLICLMIPIFYLLTVIFDLAVIAITGEDLSVIEGLQRAWNVVRANLGQVIAIAVILWLGSAIVNFVFALPMIIVGAIFMAGMGAQGGQLPNSALLAAPVLMLVYLPVLLAVSALVTSYVTSAWTVAFRRLTQRGPGTPGVIEAEANSVL